MIGMASDFQDPPELIPEFLRQWEEGYKIVLGVKEQAAEQGCSTRSGPVLPDIRRIADIEIVRQATGFGLYDRVVVEALRRIERSVSVFSWASGRRRIRGRAGAVHAAAAQSAA